MEVNLVEKIRELIGESFEADEINNENYVLSKRIRDKIADFTDLSFDWKDKQSLFYDLKNSFGDYSFDNQTHFFYNDRCLQVLASIHDTNFHWVYVFRISVFNFFSSYRHRYKHLGGKNIYDPIKFFDRGEDYFVDRVYEILVKYYPEALWLSTDILNIPVDDLNIFTSVIKKDIVVSDVLFAEVI